VSQPHSRTDEPNPPPALDEERELRAVAALLRGLPAPEPPSDLADRVLARIARYESRPRVVRVFLRHAPQRGLGTALAAGVGCLLVLGSLQSDLAATGTAGETALVPTRAHRVGDASAVPGASRARQAVVPWYELAAVIDAPTARVLVTPSIGLGSALPVAGHTDPVDQGLDRQLNHLLLDPASFYQRLDRMRDPDPFVARLAERAARRGDAAEIALELRQRVPHHVHTSLLMDRMLRAVPASATAR
jgi:hypothetical protein